MSITLVTALYNINRDKDGDGRSFEEYLSWFKKTLEIKSPMVIFIEEELKDFVQSCRKNLPTKIIIQSLQDVPYYFLNDKIQNILDDDQYKFKIGSPQRVECNMSLYNVIIYSKFPWIKEVVLDNPFNTEYFMWIDAGLSRFFDQHGIDLCNKYPSENAEKSLLEVKDNILIQTSMSYYPDLVNATICTEEYFWDARTWIMAGLWGGGSNIILKFCDMMDDILKEKMIKNNVINNEQNAMAYLYKNNEDMFIAFENYSYMHRQYELISELAK